MKYKSSMQNDFKILGQIIYFLFSRRQIIIFRISEFRIFSKYATHSPAAISIW